MTQHLFSVGQKVSLASMLPDRTRSGLFTILRLLPADVAGGLHYRIRGDDNFERAVAEESLSAGEPALSTSAFRGA